MRESVKQTVKGNKCGSKQNWNIVNAQKRTSN